MLNDWRRAIAARAATWDERQQGRVQSVDDPNPALAARRREQWRKSSAGGEDELFQRRLAWDGLEEGALLPLLGAEETSWQDALPAWTRFLVLPTAAPRVSEELAALPFAPVYFHLLEAALEEVRAGVDIREELISERALDSLVKALATEMAAAGASSLYAEFTRFRDTKSQLGEPPSENSQVIYDAFLTAVLERFESFARQYSALARHLCTLAETWVEAVGEFAVRLAGDLAEVETMFSAGQPLGPVISIIPALSDRHGRGRQVMALTFASGVRVIYKPKDLAHESSFAAMLKWLGESGFADEPPALRVLARQGYGWVEFAAQEEAPTPAAAQRYFRQAGALLCLVHLLDGNDCHMDNIVATARGPVLVDVESLLQPRVGRAAAKDDAGAFEVAARRIETSVLNTGLLPQWQRNPAGEPYDISGFGGAGGYKAAFAQRAWKHVNTDAMASEQSHRTAPGARNLLKLRGEVQSAEAYVAEIIAGFRAAYRFLLERQEQFVAGPVQSMAAHRCRLIFRPSTAYGFLLDRAHDPALLQDGLERSLHFDALARPLLRYPARPESWPLLAYERLALENGDVPIFCATANGRQVETIHGVDTGARLPQTAHEAVVNRIAGMSEADLVTQVEFIQNAFAPVSRQPTEDHLLPMERIEEIVARVEPFPEAVLLREAIRLGELVARRAIYGADGVATWMMPGHSEVTGARRGTSYYIYEGSCGMALFLAALQRITGSQRHEHLIVGVCRSVARVLNDPRAGELLAREGTGAFCGLGSAVYALTCLSRWLGQPRVLEVASRLAAFITPEALKKSADFDVIDGCAGGALALLALHSATGEMAHLGLATQCGERLLSAAVRAPSGGMAWPAPDGALLCGFSHGAAGIAYAFGRLFAATSDERFLKAAQDACTYERSVYRADRANWPIVPPPDAPLGTQPIFASTWCHGAPGILLSRLGLRESMAADELIAPEIETALETTIRTGITGIDHVCCGNMGRIDAVLTAAQRLHRPHLMRIAAAGASIMVGRAASAGGAYQFHARADRQGSAQPGFFRGVSGIGYGLLRLARPEQLPSIAMLELPHPTSN